jgi:hypothetical protein
MEFRLSEEQRRIVGGRQTDRFDPVDGILGLKEL